MKYKYKGFQIILDNDSPFKWFHDKKTFVKGYCFVDKKIYFEDSLLGYFSKARNEKEFLNLLKKADGFFSIISLCEDKMMAFVDHLRSFPLFYSETKKIVCDHIDEDIVKTDEIDENNIRQFENCLFVLGNNTLLKNYFQINAGNYILLKNKKIIQKNYWKYSYSLTQIDDIDECIKKLDLNYIKTFKRTISFLNGRKAIVPLSGGHDSRLIVFYLKKLGYKNIITYSYGSKGNSEEIISKKVSDYFGIEHYYIEYKKIKKDKDLYKKYLIYSSNAASVPCFQEFYAIKYLLDRKIIEQEDVIIPGFSGDFLAGSHLQKELLQEKSNMKNTINLITKKHFNEKRIYNDNNIEEINKQKEVIEKYLDFKYKSGEKDLNLIFEEFDFSQRQAKFIQNAVRTYEFFNLKWITPFFEKKQFKIWSEIPNKYRYERQAFFKLESKIYDFDLRNIDFFEEKKDNRIFIKLLKLIFYPDKIHYLFVFCNLKSYYINIFKKEYKNVNIYFQKDYIKIIREMRDRV